MSSKQGSVVSFVERKTTHHVVIARWNGDPDRQMVLMDRNCTVYIRFETQVVLPGNDWFGLVLLQPADALALEEDFARILKSKQARAVLKGDWWHPTERQDKRTGKMVPLVAEGYTKPGEAITDTRGKPVRPTGRGALPSCQEPLSLTERDRPSLVGPQFERFLDRNFGRLPGEKSPAEIEEEDIIRRERAEEICRLRYPQFWEVYQPHSHDLDKLTAIADRLGITYEATKKRWQRGHQFVESRIAAYAGGGT